ncbi:MAG: nucleoside hydrolase-like domain-containing protein [Verrucomicrobiota bacterium]
MSPRRPHHQPALRLSAGLALLLFLPLPTTQAEETDSGSGQQVRHRLAILADMGNEADEEQQIAHMLMNSNEFDLEALIAVTGIFLRPESRIPYRQKLHPELFQELIDAYEKVLPNLRLHASGWPEPAYLRSIVTTGQTGYGIDDVGPGKASPGSLRLMELLQKEDPRPLWLVVNAGSNTLAQALLDLEAELESEPVRFAELLGRLRIYENGAQDNAGAWLCARYPDLHWIRSNFQTYSFGGPKADIGPHFWQPYDYSPDGQDDWLKEHVRTGHGALGDRYPQRLLNERVWFMEGGGTIPWLGLVNKGLFDINEPSWGGWGGRFTREKIKNVWSRHPKIKRDERQSAPFFAHSDAADTWLNPLSGETITGEFVPVWRWRPAMYANLQCRMDWCVQPYEEANHHPVAALGSDRSDTILRQAAQPGSTLHFDASLSQDPDGDSLEFSWWHYREAGTYPQPLLLVDPASASLSLEIPQDAAGTQIHLILEVRDQNPIASLSDYRRLVIDVPAEPID